MKPEFTMPSDWAIQRALDLGAEIYTGLSKYLLTADHIANDPDRHFRIVSFARYIEANEEPPVDPYLKRAREIVADLHNLSENRVACLEGKFDNGKWLQSVLSALKETVDG